MIFLVFMGWNEVYLLLHVKIIQGFVFKEK